MPEWDYGNHHFIKMSNFLNNAWVALILIVILYGLVYETMKSFKKAGIVGIIKDASAMAAVTALMIGAVGCFIIIVRFLGKYTHLHALF